MSLLISLSALFISVLFIQIGSGSLGPLDALSGQIHGFSPGEIGLLGSAHFIGLFLGCLINPVLIRRSGHSRTFAVMAAASAISAILHPIFINLWFWCLLRMLTGFAIAGAYTVIESWLQAKLVKSNRGRVFSVYRVVDMSGTILAQGIIATLEPGTYIAYNIIAMIACLSLLPLALTQSAPPEMPPQQGFRPFFALTLSPLAGIGVVTAGITMAAFRMVGPIYATEIGLTASETALYLVMGVIGGAAIQLPAGYITDRYNRRHVLMGFSIAAIFVCFSTSLATNLAMDQPMIGYISAFFFGIATMPIYSVCATHANDFAKPGDLVDLSASLILLYSLGAIVSPVINGYLIGAYGAGAMFRFIGLIHVILIIYSFWRMSIRPVTRYTTRYRYIPRTTLFINSILRNSRKHR